jgi:dCTP deaminase
MERRPTSISGGASTFRPDTPRPVLPSPGIFVSQDLRRLVEDGAIAAGRPLLPGQIQPSSLDLRLGPRIWQLQCSFIPGPRGIRHHIEQLAWDERPLDPDEPLVLRQGVVYLAALEERLALPPGVWGRANPKSSSGRLDVFVRLLTEHGTSYDRVPEGYTGQLYAEISPQSFHVGVRRGDALGQLRLATGRPRLHEPELVELQATRPVIYWSDGRPAPVAIDDDTPGVQLSVDLHEGGRHHGQPVVGYLALRNRPPIDLRRRDLPRDQHWVPIPADPENRGVVLEPEQFYIFATRERLDIPAELCAELVPFDATKGELRTHYAGFIDSGFGRGLGGSPRLLGPDEVRGARLVLEIRTRDVPFLLEHGQPLFRVELLRNRAPPDVLYGEGVPSNYQMQGLKLAKQFA